VCFTNSLIRFQPGERVDGEFALLVFRHYLFSGRFRQEARITTNIAHLSANRFARIEFPVPPLDEQKAIVLRYTGYNAMIHAGEQAVRDAQVRADALKQSLLDAAVVGRLTQ
jgi:type I restriction enzyme S subunit